MHTDVYKATLQNSTELKKKDICEYKDEGRNQNPKEERSLI